MSHPDADVAVRAFEPAVDTAWAEDLLEQELAGRWQARGRELMDPLVAGAGGCVAEIGKRRVGIITWVVGVPGSGPSDAEVRALVVAADVRRRGIGSRLLAAAESALSDAQVSFAWLVTTNDNLVALGFYQRRGWRMTELHAGAVDDARATLKAAIGRVGAHGIPIRDELVLSLDLGEPDGGHPSIPGHLR